MSLIGSTLTSKYELIEYVNDVNQEYTQVLAEQNGGGRTDTVYTYGAGRITSEMWNQEDRLFCMISGVDGKVVIEDDKNGIE